MTEWYCTFHYPPHWIEVLHQPASDTPANGAQGSVADRVQRAVEQAFADQEAEQRQQTAEAIAPLMADDAERHAALSAHGCSEDHQGFPVHMHLTMWVGERSHPGSLDDELRALADAARDAGAGGPLGTGPAPGPAADPVEVSEVTLPAGRAVRVHQVDKVMLPSGATPVETVDLWLPVEGTTDVLWIHFWTPSLAFAADAVDVFDRMAEALVVES